jgi:hypothetical protein
MHSRFATLGFNERHSAADIEVINGGIISAISRQELVFLLTTLADYHLDFLVVYDGLNDSGQMLYYERRPNFPHNYRVVEQAWHEYVSSKKVPLWREMLNRRAILRAWSPETFGPASVLDRVTAHDLIQDPAMRRIYAEAPRTTGITCVGSARPMAFDPSSCFNLLPFTRGSRHEEE